MRTRFILLMAVAILFAGKGFSQKKPCGLPEAQKELYAAHPEVAQFVEQYHKQIEEGLKHIDYSKARKTATAGTDTFIYDIPIVVHVIHDYNNNQEYLSDDSIFDCIKDWNIVYAGANPDTSSVIPPFKKWVGIPNIRLHFATIGPDGKPTKGITRRRSYLTYIGGDQSKLDDWPRASYVNIWIVNQMSANNSFAAAYAYEPDGASSIPYYDGVICLYNYLPNHYTGDLAVSKTINHEMGHVFNLAHPFGNTNSPPTTDCSDDGVDDTPPTKGHLLEGCAYDHTALYDTVCATNYFKIYANAEGYDSLVDYPDTTNAQNIMDYTYCSRMFTIGQVARMHDALNNTLSDRNNLWTPFNLQITGALLPRKDLNPICEYSAVSPVTAISGPRYFTTPYGIGGSNATIAFHNESWNDTISTVRWQFTNGATTTDTTVGQNVVIKNNFTQPGWANITMTATDTTGTSAGRTPNTTTKTFNNAIFIADSVGVDPTTYYAEFNPSGDLSKWATFNYYNNEFLWQPCSTAGYYDNYCMKYVGFDSRIDPTSFTFPPTGIPMGDFDDMFSVPFDLSAFPDSIPCNLNFYYSGASRSGAGATNITDSLQIQYSADYGKSWHTFSTMKQSTLENKGALSYAYTPLYQGDWAPMSIAVPHGIRTKYMLFRFRYNPGVGPYGGNPNFLLSSGNNFYIDRINISRFTAAVANVKTDNAEIVVAPNPTSGNAFVILNGTSSKTASIIVTDITGKTVFTTTQELNGAETRIEIPHTALLVKGIYLVQTVTGTQSNTQKLVVY